MNNNDWEEKKKEAMKNRIPSLFEKKDSEHNDDKSDESQDEKISSDKNELERKEHEKFDDYIKRLQAEYKYDPRPDVKEDSQLWEQVLKTAEKIDKKAYWVLHGFRCGGAKLKTENGGEFTMVARTGKNHLWQSREEYMRDRKKWLILLRNPISQIFNSVK